MFFQFSPPAASKESKQKEEQKPDDKDVETLSLAPFTHNPKLAFADVPVGATAVRKLVIKNPTNRDLPLSIKHTIPDELNLDLNWLEKTAESGGEITLELSWTPKAEQSGRYMIYVSDGAKINRNIPVSFKSVIVKKKKSTSTGGAKPKQKPAKTAVRQSKSPPKYSTGKKPTVVTTKYSSSSPTRRRSLSPSTSRPKIKPTKKSLPGDTKKTEKENLWVSEEGAISGFISPSQITFNIERPVEPVSKIEERRLTYVVNEPPTAKKVLRERNESPKTFEEKLRLLKVDTPDREKDSMEKVKGLLKHGGYPYAPEDHTRSTPNLLFDRPHFDIGRFAHLNISKTETNLLDDLNTSGETYVVGNRSNSSLETYVAKENSSAETYVVEKSTSFEDFRSLIESPIAPPARSFTGPSEPRQLWPISEESSSDTSIVPKRKSDVDYIFSPPKRQAVTQPIKDWSRSGSSIFRVATKSSGLKIQKQSGREAVVTTTDTKKVIVQDPFAYANIVDPFLTSDMYSSSDWIKEQEAYFHKWLNHLLKPPKEFGSVTEKFNMDELWQQCKKQEGVPVQTKEQMSMKFHTSSRLESLRRNAANLYRSPEVSVVLTKISATIDANKLKIRDDKDLHLNLSLKSMMVTLMMSYHPLWLRIGLETVFNERIPLSSNNDLFGLSHFVLERLLKDPPLLKKYKSIYNQKYVVDIKKLFLKRFLYIVYFLDVAKLNKLIPHDPCLFCINSEIKDSRSMLINFAKETVAAIGDITKYLKFHGYIVSYVQSYIHEFNYMVTNLGVDLRDGIRLAKVMEIILMRNDLIEQLRVPPISRLQKMHNVKIVFAALENAGFEIVGDISPRDIIDGHREKTLSFLWQLIYKFEAPYIVKHVTTIQRWFRSLPVVLKRRELQRIAKQRNDAAASIQRWYRGIIKAEKLIEIACVLTLITKLQAICKGHLIRNNYLKRVSAAIIIQKNVRMYIARTKFVQLKENVIIIQRRFRANKIMKSVRRNFLNLKTAAIVVQRRFRANQAMKKDRAKFLQMKSAAVQIQTYFRGYVARKKFLQLKRCAIFIQRRFRARQERELLERRTQAAVRIQRWYRACVAMNTQRRYYRMIRQMVIFVQQRYRANRLAHEVYVEYNAIRFATINIQRFFRAYREMRIQRDQYVTTRWAVITIQRWFRATIEMRRERALYESLKSAVLVIENRYQARRSMLRHRTEYGILKRAAIAMQRRFRATQQMKHDRENFQLLKNATVFIQRKYRAQKLAINERNRFIALRYSVINIQRYYRSWRQAKSQRLQFLEVRSATLKIQRFVRATLKAKKARREYQTVLQASVKIQRFYRAYKAMETCKLNFERTKWAANVIQNRFRATRVMIQMQEEHQRLKRSACVIQVRFRAKKQMQRQREDFLSLKEAALFVQRKYRANKLARTQKNLYQQLKNAAVVIQSRYRANKLAEAATMSYSRMRWAALVIQRRYRARTVMQEEVEKYRNLRHATFIVQRRWRATVQMFRQREWFTRFRASIVTIQKYYRCYKLTKIEHEAYLKKRETVCNLQNYIRGYLARKRFAEYFSPEAIEARRVEKIQKAAAVKIQALWRGYLVRKQDTPEMLAINTRKMSVSMTYGHKQKTLGARCELALEQLLQENATLHQITKALENLDFIIRHCRASRTRMSYILPDVIYLILNSTARSLPEMTASNLAALILVSFCKYEATRENAWVPKYIDQLVTVMMHWCDKDAPLFPTLCTLMWLFAHKPEWKEFMLNLPQFGQKVDRMKAMIARKQAMSARSKTKLQFFGPVGQSRLPSKAATWGLDYNRPNVFSNSVHAFHSLLRVLGMK